MRTFLTYVAVAISTALSGCYELAEPIIETGDKAPIAGTFDCVGLFQNRRMSFTELNQGNFIWPNYRYANPDGGEMLALSKLNGTLYAAQAETKDGHFAVFMEIPGPNLFYIRAPDLMHKGRLIDALARKHGINSRPSSVKADFVRLEAPKTKLSAFIKEHSGDILTTVLECHRAQS